MTHPSGDRSLNTRLLATSYIHRRSSKRCITQCKKPTRKTNSPTDAPLLQANTPDPSPPTHTQPLAPLTPHPLRRPTDIPHLILTHPTRHRSPLRPHRRERRTNLLLAPTDMRSITRRHRTPLAQQIPDQDQRIISTGRQRASSGRGPLYAVNSRAVAFEFEERLARLADVEDADAVAVLGEGGEEMGVVGGGGEAEERGRVGHGLLGCGGGEVAWAVGCYRFEH